MCEGGRWCEEGGLAFTPNGGHYGGLVAMVTGMGGGAGGEALQNGAQGPVDAPGHHIGIQTYSQHPRLQSLFN